MDSVYIGRLVRVYLVNVDDVYLPSSFVYI